MPFSSSPRFIRVSVLLPIGPESPLQLLLLHPCDLHHLRPARQAQHYPSLRSRHARQLCQKTHTLLVRLAVHRRSRQVQLTCLPQPPRDRRPPRSRMHLYGDTRHATSARRFATPAAVRESTTSNEIASSSQSWLVPSAFCVATVRVYCCGVNQHSIRKSTSNSSPARRSPRFTCSIRVLVPYTSIPIRVRIRIPTIGSEVACRNRDWTRTVIGSPLETRAASSPFSLRICTRTISLVPSPWRKLDRSRSSFFCCGS